jgi:hypothetical protein
MRAEKKSRETGFPSATWRSYEIAVRVTRVRLAGVAVDEVVHTEAAYVVDGAGYERALYVYPFHAVDLERELRALGG